MLAIGVPSTRYPFRTRETPSSDRRRANPIYPRRASETRRRTASVDNVGREPPRSVGSGFLIFGITAANAVLRVPCTLFWTWILQNHTSSLFLRLGDSVVQVLSTITICLIRLLCFATSIDTSDPTSILTSDSRAEHTHNQPPAIRCAYNHPGLGSFARSSKAQLSPTS